MKRKQLIAGAMAVLLALTPIQGVRAEGGIAIDKSHFPDAHFREYVSSEFDKNEDGMLSGDEIGEATRVTCKGMDIRNLAGIEYFTKLKELYCSDNKLTTLDVSGCSGLKDLSFDGSKLSNLNMSGLTGLECVRCHNVTKLDVSKFTKLKSLECNDCKLQTLDVSGCTKLEDLMLEGCTIKKLNASGCTKLKRLDCSDNKIKHLDLRTNKKLRYLCCSKNKLRRLDLAKGAVNAIASNENSGSLTGNGGKDGKNLIITVATKKDQKKAKKLLKYGSGWDFAGAPKAKVIVRKK